MHIPDGFVDAKTAIAGAVMAAGGLGLAMRQVKRRLPPARVPLLGLASAFIFAAQMLNFPVYGGTSGHLVGATLAAVLLGPSAAVLVMSAVLILQCLLFSDGGLTALGVNVFNMGLVAPGVGYLVYLALARLTRPSLRGRLFAIAVAAWVSTVAAALSCAGQLALSRTAAWGLVWPAMTMIHMLIGLGEACITTLVVAAVIRARPELVSETQQPQLHPQAGEWLGHGLLVCLGLVLFITPLACSWPDGLERVAASLGFEKAATPRPFLASPLPDYTISGVDSAPLGVAITGMIGVGTAFVLAYLLARWLTPESSRAPAASKPA